MTLLFVYPENISITNTVSIVEFNNVNAKIQNQHNNYAKPTYFHIVHHYLKSNLEQQEGNPLFFNSNTLFDV